MLNVAGSDNTKYPFAVDSPSNWTGWVMQKTGVTGDTCGLTFTDGKMINPTASKWHNGANLELVEWNISSEAGDDLCTVSFDSMGGSTVPDSVIKKGGTISAPTDPTKSGYEFDKWYDDPQCTQEHNFSSPVTSYQMLYASWREYEAYAVVSSRNAVDDTLEFRYDTYRHIAFPADRTFDCEDTGTAAPGWSKFHSGTGSSQSLTTVNFTENFTNNVKPKSCYQWFYSDSPFSKLSTFNNIKNLDLSECGNVSKMFSMAGSDVSVSDFSLDVSGWNLENITDLSSMFYGVCFFAQNNKSLSCTIDINCSNWNVENVLSAKEMFNCIGNINPGGAHGKYYNISINTSNWNCNKLQSAEKMFNNILKPDGDVIIDCSGWKTDNLLNMHGTFGTDNVGNPWTGSFNIIGLKDWDTSKVTTMEQLFYNGRTLKDESISGINNWDTESVTNMTQMFCQCYDITKLDISKWNISKLTEVKYMFMECWNLQYIYCDNDWSTTFDNEHSKGMFSGCKKLPNFDNVITDSTYAYPDNGETGYFTPKTEETKSFDVLNMLKNIFMLEN